MAVGAYEEIERARRAAWKRMRHTGWATAEHAAAEQHHAELVAQRDQYLRELLAQLPFRWHVAHAYTARETATYGGGDHVVVDESIRVGRLAREPGNALSRPQRKFLTLYAVEEGRLPTAIADIRIAERLVTTPQRPPRKTPPQQLDAEIIEALRRRRR